ncbi:uncharacterized protein LOC129230410 [Uloborus diversus]|uniref:uncharacterized protein LOC129230410 n=1 Tax=Uloborus diversus TaxID=327109 RepID=UPI002408FDCF|nr:uncharacterized protein LOC129230410 [Uloborus diversus]
MLDAFSSDVARVSLQLYRRKSASLHLSGLKPVGSRDTTFHVQGEPFKTLADGDAYKFLRKPVGYSLVQDFSNLNSVIDIGKKVMDSKLAPWQRLDALRTFFFPVLQFAMRTNQFGKGVWGKIDTMVRREVKRTLNIPMEAARDLYGKRDKGSLAIPCAAEDSDLYRIDSAFKLLTSRDPDVQTIAADYLKATCAKRLKRTPSDSEMGEFMSGSMKGNFAGSANEALNVWTCARAASRRLGVSWTFQDRSPELQLRDVTVQAAGRRKLTKSFREKLRDDRSRALAAKPSQGKTMECVAADKASSHFLYDGSYTMFADWRFVHRARLNFVPLNACKPWLRGNNRACRRCKAREETLPHVTSHCMRNSQAMQIRHNVVLKRVVKAAGHSAEVVSVNQRVGPDNLNLRPDAVIKRRRGRSRDISYKRQYSGIKHLSSEHKEHKAKFR